MRKHFLGLITRCKDEFFINEFCEYYLSQGVDKIYIIDDNSYDKSIYNNINKDKIEIIYMNNKNNKAHIGRCEKIRKNCTCNRVIANKLFLKIKSDFKWMIFCDVDEFITTKKHLFRTIKDELKTVFKNVDCIKVPWVMMSSNGLRKNPKSIIDELIYRWDHNKKHPSIIKKFRCRYEKIEVKCIFKCKDVCHIRDHYPIFNDKKKQYNCVDSIECKKDIISATYNNLREHNIKTAFLVCYHYRLISEENNINKLKNNNWYIENGYCLNDLMDSDYPEILDRTLKYKKITNILRSKQFKLIRFLHIGKCGGSGIRMKFPKIQRKHMKKPSLINNKKWIIILRNPINRFVSAFYHSKYFVDFDVSGYDKDMLYNNKNTPYYHLRRKIHYKLKFKNPFHQWKSGGNYKSLISYFKDANHLAESLSSSNKDIKKMAYDLCNNDEIEHIFRGIGWYLYNGEFIEKNKNNIIYCEDINNINYRELSILIGDEGHSHYNAEYIRKNHNKTYNKFLSELAILNIKNFYKNTDYTALQKLYEYKFISKELFEKYHNYKI